MKASKGSSRRTGHKHSSPINDKDVDQTPFDEFERDILQIARLFFKAFDNPESHAWVNAFYFAELRLHAPYGATIANAVLMSINAMRIVRSSGFNYLDPNCQTCKKYITDEERYFIGTLHNIRLKRRSAVKMNAMLLCQGSVDIGFTEAMGRLAVITADYEGSTLKGFRSE